VIWKSVVSESYHQENAHGIDVNQKIIIEMTVIQNLCENCSKSFCYLNLTLEKWLKFEKFENKLGTKTILTRLKWSFWNSWWKINSNPQVEIHSVFELSPGEDQNDIESRRSQNCFFRVKIEWVFLKQVSSPEISINLWLSCGDPTPPKITTFQPFFGSCWDKVWHHRFSRSYKNFDFWSGITPVNMNDWIATNIGKN